MARKKKRSKKDFSFVYVLIGVVFGAGLLGLGYLIGSSMDVEPVVETVVQVENYDLISSAEIVIPAVDDAGKGVATILSIGVTEGIGRALVDIDTLLFWTDTQSSIRTARNVAANITGIDDSDYNLIYEINADAAVIGGPSAGAAITIATVAALEGFEINDHVMITGGINHDGTISPVSGILEKATAAKDIGAEVFLVPLLQSQDVIYETREYCELIGGFDFCTVEQYPVVVDLSSEADLEVIEVGTVEEALEYFRV